MMKFSGYYDKRSKGWSKGEFDNFPYIPTVDEVEELNAAATADTILQILKGQAVYYSGNDIGLVSTEQEPETRVAKRNHGIMDETLSGLYKELWIEYQNSEGAEVKDLTYDQLIERVKKWESIEFEAKARRQKCIAERRSRDIEKDKAQRDSLITNPHYTPTQVEAKPKVYAPRRTREEKLRDNFAEEGLNLDELMREAEERKKLKVKGVDNA